MELSLNPSMNLITDDLKLLITDYTENFRTRNGAEFESFYESDSQFMAPGMQTYFGSGIYLVSLTELNKKVFKSVTG